MLYVDLDAVQSAAVTALHPPRILRAYSDGISETSRDRWFLMDPLNEKLLPFLAEILYHGLPHGATDHASFISTASSHDLTTHHRVNTSSDPAMGFWPGAPGHGVGRFNAGKLLAWVESMTSREEWESRDRLNLLENAKNKDDLGDAVEPDKKLSGASKRSYAGTFLANVQEDVAAGLKRKLN